MSILKIWAHFWYWEKSIKEQSFFDNSVFKNTFKKYPSHQTNHRHNLSKEIHTSPHFRIFMKPYSTHTLPNGIRFLYHQTKAPVLYLSWGVAAGSAHDNVFGTAHFCEHLMFTGTHRFPNYDEILLSLGATNNAWTDRNHTV